MQGLHFSPTFSIFLIFIRIQYLVEWMSVSISPPCTCSERQKSRIAYSILSDPSVSEDHHYPCICFWWTRSPFGQTWKTCCCQASLAHRGIQGHDIGRRVPRVYRTYDVNCLSFRLESWPLFEYTQAPGEAEAELAQLNAHNIIDAVLTEDSDTFIFGATNIIRK